MAAQREQAVRVARGMLKHMVAPLISQMGLNKETAEPVALLDNACGSGVLTQEVQAALEQDVLQKSSFTCADVAPNMVDLVKWRVENEGWINTEVKNLDAMVYSLPPSLVLPHVLTPARRTRSSQPNLSRTLESQWVFI